MKKLQIDDYNRLTAILDSVIMYGPTLEVSSEIVKNMCGNLLVPYFSEGLSHELLTRVYEYKYDKRSIIFHMIDWARYQNILKMKDWVKCHEKEKSIFSFDYNYFLNYDFNKTRLIQFATIDYSLFLKLISSE